MASIITEDGFGPMDLPLDAMINQNQPNLTHCNFPVSYYTHTNSILLVCACCTLHDRALVTLIAKLLSSAGEHAPHSSFVQLPPFLQLCMISESIVMCIISESIVMCIFCWWFCGFILTTAFKVAHCCATYTSGSPWSLGQERHSRRKVCSPSP